MLEVITVTKWYKVTRDKDSGEIIKRSFNHYEEGIVRGNYPAPFDPSYSNQTAWQNEEWHKQFTYLDNFYENGKLISSQLGNPGVYIESDILPEDEWDIKFIEEEE